MEQPVFRYLQSERRKILEELPKNVDGEAVVSGLEEIATGYRIFKIDNARVRLKAMRERYRRIEATLSNTREILLNEGRAFWIGLDRDGLLEKLHAVIGRTSEFREMYGKFLSNLGGRKNPFKELMYRQVLSIWINAGGRLATSKSPTKPSGPTIRFLTAALAPVMVKDTPGPEGLRAIVSKEKNRRNQLAQNKKSRSFWKESRESKPSYLPVKEIMARLERE